MQRLFFLGMNVLVFVSLAGCSQEKMQQSVDSAQQAAQDASKSADAAAAAAGDAAESAQKAADEAKDAIKGATDKIADSVAGATDTASVTKDFSELFASITKSLSSVTDAASAPEAAAQLEKTGGTLKGLIERFNALPTPVKSAVADTVSKGVEGIKPLVEKVLAIPGVGDILRKHIDTIMSQLDQVTKPKA